MLSSPHFLHLFRSLARGLALVAAVWAPCAFAQTYTFTYLGTLGGESAATSINNAGTVVGYSQLSTINPLAVDRQGFVYTTGGPMQSVGLLNPAGQESYSYDINSTGVITGNSYLTSNVAPTVVRHAYTYVGGTMTDLGTLGGTSSFGYAINDAGHVVGDSHPTGNTGSAPRHAFWDNGPTMLDLHAAVTVPTSSALNAPLDAFSIGYDINNNGQIVGASHSGSTFPNPPFTGFLTSGHAFLYSTISGTSVSLGALGGANSVAYGINDVGQVAGAAQLASLNYHAFRYTNGQPMEDLGTLGGSNSVAYDINAGGDVVGISLNADGFARAFIDRNGTMLDLNSLVSNLGSWTLIDARGINDQGDIVGIATSPNHVGVRAFLLTAVPEPSTYAVILGAVTLLVVIGRRHMRKRV